jgi:hypothetical protein
VIRRRATRGMSLAGFLLCVRCAKTVYRLDGEVPTSAGAARTECEERDWLVLGPTRSEIVSKEATRSEARDDALGLYPVGGRRPRSITRLEKEGAGTIATTAPTS